jgi:hypothetical protein
VWKKVTVPHILVQLGSSTDLRYTSTDRRPYNRLLLCHVNKKTDNGPYSGFYWFAVVPLPSVLEIFLPFPEETLRW